MSSSTGTNNKTKPSSTNTGSVTTGANGTNKSKNVGTSNTPATRNSANKSASTNASLAENLADLTSNAANNLIGINTTNVLATSNNKPKTANNTTAVGRNKGNNSGGLFGNLLANTTVSSPSTVETAANSISNPAQTLVSTTETAIKSASNKLSEVKDTVSDRLQELSTGSNIGMNILKIVITVLILIALFYVAKYLFTRYQDAVYAAPMLLDGIKNGKHAMVISQDPANPSYIPMPKSDEQTSLEFTYDFWLLIDSYEYKKGEWKHLFHKGNSSSYPNRAPGVWLHPDTNAMRIYMNTQDNILEYVDVDNLPLRKWIHVSLVLHDMDLDVFINGYLKKRQKLTSVPKLNNGDFWVNMFGGFEGYLARIRYYAKAIGVDEIAANVRAGPGDSNCIDTGQTPPYLDDDWWSS